MNKVLLLVLLSLLCLVSCQQMQNFIQNVTQNMDPTAGYRQSYKDLKNYDNDRSNSQNKEYNFLQGSTNFFKREQFVIRAEKFVDEMKKRGGAASLSLGLDILSICRLYQGLYDDALEVTQKALAHNEKHHFLDQQAKNYAILAHLYLISGKETQAFSMAENGIRILKDFLDNPEIVIIDMLQMMEGIDIDKYKDSVQLDKEAITFAKLCLTVNIFYARLTIPFRRLGYHDFCINKYKSAAALFRKYNYLSENNALSKDSSKEVHQWFLDSYLGNIAFLEKKYSSAILYFQKVEAYGDKLMNSDEDHDFNYLTNTNSLWMDLFMPSRSLAVSFYMMGKYEKARSAIRKHAKYMEQARKDLNIDERKEFFSEELEGYQLAICASVQLNDPEKAFFFFEFSTSRALADQLSSKKLNINIPDLTTIQNNLDKDTVLVLYSNTALSLKYYDSPPINDVIILVTKEKVTLNKQNYKNILNTAITEYSNRITTTNQHFQKLTDLLVQDSDQGFVNLLQYYRELLLNPSSSKDDINTISQSFYQALISPIEQTIKNKKNIVIIPDRFLSLLPFETLKGSDEKYLVEKYNISYSPSVTTLHLLQKRQYSNQRKPILALGGANYSGSKSKSYISDIALPQWQELIGTRTEVENIGKVIPQAQIVTGSNASEQYIKQLNNQKELVNFKSIHFATHGFSYPENPEYSAIVLSQDDEEQDGYLSVQEIPSLELQADFVNLSACETGLGRLYNGEGVIGLGQAFFVAGANSLSVSLWPVNDTSTMVFMIRLYEKIYKEKMGYVDAITQIKREFILKQIDTKLTSRYRGLQNIRRANLEQDYSHPYYWAPFVFYGSAK